MATYSATIRDIDSGYDTTLQLLPFGYSSSYYCPMLCPAPILCIDSASPLGVLPAFPFSTAVSVGAKYLGRHYVSGGGYQVAPFYWECTVAGTTGTTTPDEPTGDLWYRYPNKPLTSGTATFVKRFFHGWNKAWAISTAYTVAVTPPFGTGSTFVDYEQAYYIASTSATTISSTSLYDTYIGQTYIQGGWGSRLVSVGKAWPPTAFTAGASIKNTLNSAARMAMSVIRGLSYGHDNTAVTMSGEYFPTPAQFILTGIWYDCSLTTNRGETYYSESNWGNMFSYGGTFTAYNTSFANTAASIPDATFGMRGNGGASDAAMLDIAGCTATRSTAATSTPIFRYFSDLNASAAFSMHAYGLNASSIAAPLFGFKERYTTYTKNALVNLDSIAAGAGTPAARADGYNVTYNECSQSTTFVDHQSLDDGRGWAYDDLADYNYLKGYTLLNRTYARSGGASDSVGAYSFEVNAINLPRRQAVLVLDNTKVDEGFTLTFEFEWSNPGGSGITALSAEDIVVEAVYLQADGPQLALSYDPLNRRGLIYNGPTPTMHPTSTATWSGSLATAVKQSVSITVNPTVVGPIIIRFNTWLSPWTMNLFTGTSLTIYIDPEPIVSVPA